MSINNNNEQYVKKEKDIKKDAVSAPAFENCVNKNIITTKKEEILNQERNQKEG